MEKKVSLMDLNGNPNIGIYMFVNNKFCLLGQNIKESKKEEIEKTLGVPVYEISILSTELIGVFLAGNDNLIITPSLFEKEKQELEKICNKHDTKLLIIDELKNTFGNNICVGNDKILVNSNYSEEFIKNINKQTKLETIKVDSKKYDVIGSTILFLNNKYFVSQEYEEKDVKKILDDIAGVGTINQGSSLISSGIIGNKNGIIIGSMSTSVEIQNIVESLDYI